MVQDGQENTPEIKLQILLVGTYPPPYGGISVHIERLKKTLDNSGNYDCFVLDTSGMQQEKKQKDKAITCVSGNIVMRLIKSLFAIKKYKGEIIHYHVSAFYNFQYVGIIFNWINKKAKKIITIHSGSFIKYYLNGSWLRKNLIKISLSNYDHIITVNYDQEVFLKKDMKITSHITTIPAFLLPRYIEKANSIIEKEMDDYKKCFGKVIVSSGSLLEHYGFHIIIQAIKELKMDYLDKFGLILVAYGSENVQYKNDILRKVRDVENIKFYYDLTPSEFSRVLEKSDIFIRATDRDGDAVAVREAIYFKHQIIASDCVKRPDGALLFSTMDKNDLIIKLKYALDNSEAGKVQNEIENSKELLNVYSFVTNNR